MITLELTKQQAEKLEDILNNTTDEGPWHEGWASDELEELRELMKTAIERGD